MSKRLLLLFALLAAMAILLSPLASRAQEDADEDHPFTADSGEEMDVSDHLEDDVVEESFSSPDTAFDDAGSLIGTLEPHPDISLSVHFPSSPDRQLLQGEMITALVGISNKGNQAFNISFSGGHLHSVIDHSYYVQNFSVYHVDQVVLPNSESTIEYWFKPDENLEPVDFTFSGWLIYNTTNGAIFKSQFANETVWLVEPPTTFDLKAAFTWLILLGCAGGIGYAIYSSSQGGKKAKKRRQQRAAAGQPAPVWEAAKIYTPSTSSKSVSKKKHKKPSDSKKKSTKAE